MHKQQFLPLLLAAFAVAKPQSMNMNGLSSCAQGIVLAQIGATPCGSDVACVCKDSSFIGSLRTLINASCGESDATAADLFYRTTCANNGVSIDADAAPAPAADMTPASDAAVTSTMSMISTQTDMPAAGGDMTMDSSVTGDPSMTATSDMMMASGTTLGGDMMGSCVVSTTTVCQTATMAPTSTGTNPSAFTGAADVVGISGVLAGLAVMAALL